MTFDVPVEAVGPGTPAGTLLRQHWQPVALASDLAPGQAKPVRVLGEDLTVYRDEASRVRVVGGRCAHRGTFLHTGWVEGDCIRCFYHGWKFDPTGACVEQPAEPAGFATAAHIAAYHGEEYAGLVFVYLGPGDPPPLPRYPELDAPGVEVVAGIRPPGPWPMNYFQALENNVDPVHLSFVHRATEPFTREVPEVRAARVAHGISMTAIRGGVAAQHDVLVPPDDPTAALPDPRRPDRVPRSSTGSSRSTTRTRSSSRRPRSRRTSPTRVRPDIAGRTMEASAADELMSGARRPASVTEEDYVAMVGQGTVADRSSERLGRSDVGIVELRRLSARAPRRPRLTRPNTRGGLLTTST